jgi:FkbM family methyltransferase
MKRSYRALPIPLRPVLHKLASLRGLQVIPVPPNGTDRGTYAALSSDPIKVIFDVGANVGKVAVAFAAEFPEAVIYSFEPVSTTFQEHRRTTSHLRNVRAIQMAIGRQECQVRMTVAADSQLCRMDTGEGGVTEIVKMSSVDAFCAIHGIDTIDILKTDTEGHELEVFEGANNALSRIRFVLVEFGTVADDPNHVSFERIYADLLCRGFVLASIFEPSYTRTGLLRYANALFYRKAGQRETIGSQQRL